LGEKPKEAELFPQSRGLFFLAFLPLELGISNLKKQRSTADLITKLALVAAMTKHTLKVIIHKGTGLMSADSNGFSDPYVSMR
jgi:hypothetical protein